jgi:hypothetical protein
VQEDHEVELLSQSQGPARGGDDGDSAAGRRSARGNRVALKKLRNRHQPTNRKFVEGQVRRSFLTPMRIKVNCSELFQTNRKPVPTGDAVQIAITVVGYGERN